MDVDLLIKILLAVIAVLSYARSEIRLSLFKRNCIATLQKDIAKLQMQLFNTSELIKEHRKMIDATFYKIDTNRNENDRRKSIMVQLVTELKSKKLIEMDVPLD